MYGPADKPDGLKHVKTGLIDMNFNDKYMSTDNTVVQFPQLLYMNLSSSE